MFERPFLYVLEYAYTGFYGELEGALGFNDLHSFGIGLELDTSKYDIIVTRVSFCTTRSAITSTAGGSGLAVRF